MLCVVTACRGSARQLSHHITTIVACPGDLCNYSANCIIYKINFMKQVFYFLAAAMLCASCSSNNKKNQLELQTVKDSTGAAPRQAYAEQPDHQLTKAPVTTTTTNWERKIIKTADLAVELKDYARYDKEMRAQLKNFGAYIASEEQRSDGLRLSNTMSIKVPVAQFDNLVNSFGGEGAEVVQKRISSDDVSGELVDIRSRTEAKKQVREKYLQLLKQAKNMKEILEVQTELNSLQEDIDAATAGATFLSHQSAFSTVNLTYYQLLTDTPHAAPPSFITRLTNGFMQGLQGIGSLLVLVVTIWPLVVLVGLIVFVLTKRRTT